jgi:hypothetical protein
MEIAFAIGDAGKPTGTALTVTEWTGGAPIARYLPKITQACVGLESQQPASKTFWEYHQ